MTRQIPTEMISGYQFTVNAQSSLTPIYAYTYTLSLRGPSSTDFLAVPTNNGFTITGTAPVSGKYRYTCYGTDSNAAKHLIEVGDITVLPDPASIAVGADLQSHEEKVLAAIEAVIEKRATLDQQAYSLNGRTLQRTPIADLLKLRDYYRAAVQSRLKKLPRKALVQFGNN